MIPTHLARYPWYALHQAWLRQEYGTCRHDPGDAAPSRADLTWIDFWMADLRGADLRGGILVGAKLCGSNCSGATFAAAELTDASLESANLTGASLWKADLTRACFWDVALGGATLPDGRIWEEYRADHLAGICTTQEVRECAMVAWGSHKWGTCPMSLAHGWGSMVDVPADLRLRVAAWVAFYDAGLLPAPEAA